MSNEEKDLIVDKTIEALNKKHGEGTVMRLGDIGGASIIPKFTSGIASLDLALGGGWPWGRMIEIYGPESSGKCLTEDTMILTHKGYRSIKEIFNEVGLETKCDNKEVEISYPLVNKDGKIEETTHFVYNGEKTVFEITTETGAKIKATKRHPLCVLNNQGRSSWKYVEDIKEGNYLVGRQGDMVSSNKRFVSRDKAFFVGMSVSKDKKECVPKAILESSIDIQRSFLKGFFDRENSISLDNKYIEGFSSSGKLINEMRLMLKNIGIVANVKENVKENCYTISIPLGDSYLLEEGSKEKGSYNFERVVSVKEIGSLPTFDFAMKETHTFIAEGIVNHNTSVALFALAEVQKLGKEVAFIDLENALDPMLAEMYGVDTNRLLLSYPMTGEAAFEVVEGLAMTGKVGAIVLDSVSAIIPTAEREEDVGKPLPAIQARLMSQVLRRLVGVCGKTGTTVFFINQIREKVGVLYGKVA